LQPADIRQILIAATHPADRFRHPFTQWIREIGSDIPFGPAQQLPVRSRRT
jgi:hypothetical protein